MIAPPTTTVVAHAQMQVSAISCDRARRNLRVINDAPAALRHTGTMGLELLVDAHQAGGTVAHTRSTEPAAHARLLALYIATGLFFMLLPGTFLGVWNLLQVSARHSVGLVSPAWLQAHGHAQIFGWVATFILGIGFYSIPIVTAGARPSLISARLCWALWTTGVAMRWAASVYDWHWRVLIPISAGLELAAFVVFRRAVSQHRSAVRRQGRLDPWVRLVIAGSMGFALTLVMNLALSVYVAWVGASPAIPHELDQRFLVLVTWGFLAPFVWGFSSKWLPVLLGLRPLWVRGTMLAIVCNTMGVLLTLAGWGTEAAALFVIAAALIVSSLHLFEPSVQPPKTRGVHRTFPLFVRTAYVWLLVAAVLGVAAEALDVSGGIWGASRHAFTVGFIAVMVFSIAQRVLPAFAATGPLWSPRLMFTALLLLTAGCAIRVASEILAYQHGVAWAWDVLPVSAFLELGAVAVFAFNMVATFACTPEPLARAPATTHANA
jgi:hypothetical protein